MQALIDLPSPSNSLSSLHEFYDSTEGYIRSLSSLGKSEDSYGSLLVPIILGKLPPKVKQNLVRAHGGRSQNCKLLSSMNCTDGNFTLIHHRLHHFTRVPRNPQWEPRESHRAHFARIHTPPLFVMLSRRQSNVVTSYVPIILGKLPPKVKQNLVRAHGGRSQNCKLLSSMNCTDGNFTLIHHRLHHFTRVPRNPQWEPRESHRAHFARIHTPPLFVMLSRRQSNVVTSYVPIILGKLPPKVKQNLVRAHGGRSQNCKLLSSMNCTDGNFTLIHHRLHHFTRVPRNPQWEPRESHRAHFARIHTPPLFVMLSRRQSNVVTSYVKKNCLGHHKVASCNSKHRCRNCQRKNHTSLCTHGQQDSNPSEQPVPPVNTTPTKTAPVIPCTT